MKQVNSGIEGSDNINSDSAVINSTESSLALLKRLKKERKPELGGEGREDITPQRFIIASGTSYC